MCHDAGEERHWAGRAFCLLAHVPLAYGGVVEVLDVAVTVATKECLYLVGGKEADHGFASCCEQPEEASRLVSVEWCTKRVEQALGEVVVEHDLGARCPPRNGTQCCVDRSGG